MRSRWITGGTAGFFLLFLLWLALWTFGGLAGITELLRSLAGEDRISLHAGGVELVRRAGPFRRARTIDRVLIRRVRIRRHDKAVVVDTTTGSELTTRFSTADERRSMADWMRQQLSLPDDDGQVDTAASPPGWRMTVEGNTVRLSRSDLLARRTGALIAWAIAALLGLIGYGSLQTGLGVGSVVALATTLVVASWAAWLTWAHRVWLVQHGGLTSHRRFAVWVRERSFNDARLEVEESTDSDNDDHYALKIIGDQGQRTIASEVNDEADVVDLGRWLAARTGFTLTLPAGMQRRRTVPVTQDELT